MNRNQSLTNFIYILVFFLLVPLNAFAGNYHDYKKPEDVVSLIYRDYAFEAIMPSYSHDVLLINQPKKVLLKYFTEELASLIIKDRKDEQKTQELGRLV